MLSDFDRENISKIMAGHGDWFTARLLRLIGKADPEHRMRLALGFPAEVAAAEQWLRSVKEDEKTQAPSVDVVHDPKNTFRIESVWAYISQDEDGNEGVCAVNGLPLLAADPTRLAAIRGVAVRMKELTPKKIILIRLHQREDMEEI